MPKVSVLATGGTIATRRRADGSSVAAASAEELVASLPALPDVEVVVDDVFRMKPLVRGHETERIEIPANWYLDVGYAAFTLTIHPDVSGVRRCC